MSSSLKKPTGFPQALARAQKRHEMFRQNKTKKSLTEAISAYETAKAWAQKTGQPNKALAIYAKLIALRAEGPKNTN